MRLLSPALAALLAALLAGFIVWALRGDGWALVDIRLLSLRLARVSSLILILPGATLLTSNFLLPLYLQQLRGLSVLAAALFSISQGVGSLVPWFVAAQLVNWFGRRLVPVIGFVLIAVATLAFIIVSPDGALILLGTVLFVRGLGLGVVRIPVMTSAYADIRHEQRPMSQRLRGSPNSSVVPRQQRWGHASDPSKHILLSSGDPEPCESYH